MTHLRIRSVVVTFVAGLAAVRMLASSTVATEGSGAGAGTPASLIAADTAATPVEDAPIEQARRRFEAVKGHGQSQALGKSPWSALRLEGSVPTLDVAPPPPSAVSGGATSRHPAGAGAPVQGNASAGGANWLIDSLRDSAERGARTRLSADAGLYERHGRNEDPLRKASAGPRRGGSEAGDSTMRGWSAGLDATRGQEREPLPTDRDLAGVSAPNPLAPYLASWMSTRDYGLLVGKNARNPGDADEARMETSGVSTLGRLTAAQAVSNAVGRNVEAKPGQTTSLKPVRDGATGTPPNPYLAALSLPPTPVVALHTRLPAPPAETIATPNQAATSGLPKAIPAPTPQPQPAPVPVPETAGTREDRKYFPQLKRF